MTEKEKNPGSAATLTGIGTETAACGRAAISYGNSTTATARRQVPRVSIADFLAAGVENGLTMKELRQFLNGDSRSIRGQIERERRTAPILSGPTGYYLPSCEDETRCFLGSMRRRARAIWTSAANVERAAGLSKHAPQLDGQLEIQIGGDSD